MSVMRSIDSRRQSTFHPHALRLFTLGLLCVLLACGASRSPLNVIIIGVDTLRADHLGCYGYDRNTSPNIDRLAQDGVLFENAIAPSPWTLPSFASIFTSLYPSQHGARNSRNPMGSSFPTIATIFKEHGYRTGAIINAPYLKRVYKVDRGFDTYDMPPRGGRYADGTTRDALTWIDNLAHEPFFLFIHYFDPHLPYAPPAPYDTIFDPTYHGKIGSRFYPKQLPRVRLRNVRDLLNYSDSDWYHIEALYDGDIAFTDEAIGNLIDGLRERHLLDRTLIVFLSDHGEEFLEHGGFEHGHSLYNELLHVPLMIVLEGRIPRGLRLRRQVRLVDVAPTILDLVGLDYDACFEGVSLVPLLDRRQGGSTNLIATGTLLPPGLAFSECILYGTEKKSITAFPWKVIYDVESGERMRFNLASDPGEKQPLTDTTIAALDALEQALDKTVIAITDTWFIEISGGDSTHTFDIDLTTDVIKGSGNFAFHRLIDSDGTIKPLESIQHARIRSKRIAMEDVLAPQPVRLAIKRKRVDAPLGFDFKIDGKPALNETYIGVGLVNPESMPFNLADAPDSSGLVAVGEPAKRPKPPYVLVWLEKSGYGEHPMVELDEETRRQLHSLGYLQ